MFIMRRVYVILVNLSLAAALSACGEPVGQSVNTAEVQYQSHRLNQSDAAKAQTQGILDQVLMAQLPPGVEQQTWTALQDELARVLLAGAHSFGTVKTASFPPITGGSRAVLSLDMSGGGNGILRWGLYLHGDCNQDGQVGVADLAPLGQRFGEVSPGGLGVPFPSDSSGAVLDGSWDGSINLPDVAPIGQNWGRRTAGYRVYRSHNPADVPQVAADTNGAGAELVADVALSGAIAEAGQRKRFELVLTEAATDWLYWVRPYDGADEGTPSNSVPPTGADNLAPIAVLGAEPSSGLAPLTVRLQGFSSGDLDGIIVKYEWDFDGVVGGENWADTGAQGWVEHVYDAPGDYLPMLRVTDNAGGQATDTALVKVRVAHPPAASLSVTPDSGPVVLHVVFDAGGSTDADGPIAKYEWDWQSDGVYDYDSGTTPTADFYYYAPGTVTATVRVTDIDGLTSTAQTSVNATAGATWHKEIVASNESVGAEPGGLLGPVSLINANQGTGKFAGLFYREIVTSGTDFALLYRLSGGYEGSAWSTPTRVDPQSVNLTYAEPSSMRGAMVAGCPAILYDFHVGGPIPSSETRYARALSGDGSQWNAPITIPNSDPPFTVLITLTGAPAFAANSHLFRSIDTIGSSWTDLGLVFPFAKPNSILEVNGRPAVFAGTSSLFYMRANDALGESWPIVPVIVSGNTVLESAGQDFIVAGSNPATTWRTDQLDSIFFVRASDVTGSTWSLPILVAPYTSEKPNSLTVIDGRPFVIFKSSYSDEVSFIAANNTEGTSWCLPTSGVPWFTDLNLGSYSDPVDIDGHPAIALYDIYDMQPNKTYSEISYVVFY